MPSSRSPSRSPSSSPPVIQASSLPAPPLLYETPAKKCPIKGCGQKRIALDCMYQWCRNIVSPSIREFVPRRRTSVSAPLTTTGTVPSTTSKSPSVPNASLPIATPVQPAYPRCSSKLDSAFVDVLAHDQELWDTRRVEDARHHESERRAKQSVKVFAWTTNGCEPTCKGRGQLHICFIYLSLPFHCFRCKGPASLT